MIKSLLRLFVIILSMQFLGQANAAISFKIDGEDIAKTRILFGNVKSLDPAINQDVAIILKTIKKNLKSTDLFSILHKQQISAVDVPTDDLAIETIPDFIKYSNLGIGMLLVVDAAFNQIGDIEIKIRLWDVLDERQLFGKFYSSNKGNYKKIADLIADEIFKVATGEELGHFDSRITYVAESGGALKRKKRIAMMDFDGSNHHYLTNGRDLVLNPTYSNQREEVFFVRFFGDKPQIYSLDLNNNLVRKIGGFYSTTFAPTINPANHNIIAFSVINGSNSDIYEMNLQTSQLVKLTNNKAIDTTPSYSPDGNKIVFSSDRSGSEQIYVIDLQKGVVKRITNSKGSYSKPVWSPDGKFIAFTKLKSNRFNIGIIDANGGNEKLLTSGYLVEGAKWSPNSRYIVYSRKNGPYGKSSIPKLYVIDILTGFERQIPTPKNEGATDPDWVMN